MRLNIYLKTKEKYEYIGNTTVSIEKIKIRDILGDTYEEERIEIETLVYYDADSNKKVVLDNEQKDVTLYLIGFPSGIKTIKKIQDAIIEDNHREFFTLKKYSELEDLERDEEQHFIKSFKRK